MTWNTVLYESKRGEKPVEEFIKSLDEQTIAKVAHEIDLLEKHGAYLGMPHSRKLTSNLFELRIRGRVEVRMLYAFIRKDMYLLSVFKKKQQKTPRKELNTALQRLKSLK